MIHTKDAFAPEIQQLMQSSPYPMAVCSQDGTILNASESFVAQRGSDGSAASPLAVSDALPDLGEPQLLGQLSASLWLYGWLRPLAGPSSEAAAIRAHIDNRLFQVALEQVGLYVFEYRVDRDEFHLLVPSTALGLTTQTYRGGPDLISNYIHASEEDALFLADAFANAAFGRSASLDVSTAGTDEPQWLRITLAPILRETRMTGVVVGTIQNVTSQKLAEERVNREAAFRNNVLSGVSSGWELDLEQGTWLQLWNGEPALSFLREAQMHYDNYDLYLTETLQPLIHPDDWAGYRAVMERGALLARFRRGEHSCAVEYRIHSRPGKDSPYEWRNVTVQLALDSGTFRPKASCHVTDITPQKANELEAQREKRAMERTAREERRANARKSQFLADTSLTLHAPLRAMVGVSELALQEQMSDTAREYLQQIHDFGDDLLQIFSDVLALADRGSQPGIPTEEEYSPRELMQNVADLAARHGRRATAPVVHLDGVMPSRLYGDSMRLRQALINLAGSALRASDSVELHLSCPPQDSEHVLMQITVLDRTSSLTENQLLNLFVAFSQLGSRYGGGTGLELSLARQLVRLMDGDLSAVPVEPAGVEFRVSVPQRVIDARPEASV